MRIKLIIVVLLFSFTTFISSRTIENDRLWLSIAQREFDDAEIFRMYFYGEEFSRSSLVLEILEEAKNSGVSIFFTRENTETGIEDAYVFSTDGKDIFDGLPLIGTKEIDFSRYDQPQYYISKVDERSNGLLFNYFKNHSSTYTINNFYDVINTDVRLEGSYRVLGSKDGINSFVEAINSYYETDLLMRDGVSDKYKDDSYGIIIQNAIPLVSSFLLLILIIFQVITDNAKEFAIRKTLGQSTLLTMTNMFWCLVPYVIFLQIFSYTVLYLFLVGTVNKYTLPLLNLLFLLVMGLFIIVVSSIFIVTLWLSLIPSYSWIKNKGFLKSLFNFSFIIKTIIILLMVPHLYSLGDQIIQLQVKSTDIKKVEELTRFYTGSSYHYIYTSLPGYIDELYERVRQDILKEENSFGTSMSHILVEGSQSGIDIIHLEQSYYEMFFENLPELNPNSNFFIIGHKSDSELINKYFADKSYTYIEKIENYSQLFMGFIGTNFSNNPILVIYPTHESLMKHASNVNYFNIASNQKDADSLREKLNQKYIGEISFGNNENLVRVEKKLTNDLLRSKILEAGQYLLVVLTALYLGNSTLLLSEKKKIGILTILGYPNFKKKIIFIIGDGIIFGMLFLYLNKAGLPIVNNLGLVSFVILMDYVLISIMLHYHSKNNVLKTLGNG